MNSNSPDVDGITTILASTSLDENSNCFRMSSETVPMKSRWKCESNSCKNVSPPFLVVPEGNAYCCPKHHKPQPHNGSELITCSAMRNDGTDCTMRDYRVIYSNQKHKDIFLCEYHELFMRGQLVRDRREKFPNPLQPTFSRQPSADIEVHIVGKRHPCVVFNGSQFDELTQGYDSEIKASIRSAIYEYFEFLSKPQEAALKELRKQLGRKPSDEESEKLEDRYRDHLARGCIYLLMPFPSKLQLEKMSSEDQTLCEKGVLIKIGYTSNLKKRLQCYKRCEVSSDPIKTFPETPTDSETGSDGLGFVHLLEKILHQIWTFEQRDILCKCAAAMDKNGLEKFPGKLKCHTEIFVFEREVDEERMDAFDENVKLMQPHIERWLKAIELLENRYKEILDSHKQEL
ncbi:hypothetical protein BGX27_001090 [Mortierella sp. AM989]|nr:hypothetical protein BGX27_001090 [Mortierella sp. AM989]